MSTSIHVFDVDDTLFDTYLKNRASYTSAGLPIDYTLWHHRHNNKLWLGVEDCIEIVKQKKAEVEHMYMYLVKKLPYLEIYKSTGGVCLTGASESAVRQLEDHFGIELRCVFGYSKTTKQKKDILAELSSKYDEVHYYDDDREILLEIEKMNPAIILHKA